MTQGLWSRCRQLSTGMQPAGLQLSSWLRTFLFPAHCRLCGTAPVAAPGLCQACSAELPWIEDACPKCGRPWSTDHPAPLCGACLKQPPAYDAATAALHYQPPVDYLIQRLKFSGELAVAPLLAGLLATRLAARPASLPHCLIPVPLHRRRLRARGFNQATELARHLGRQLCLPVDHRLCGRDKWTEPQSLTPLRRRSSNLRGAFSVRGELPEGAHVAIIDDVLTTGHTAEELARVLRRAGALRVELWVIARSGH
jgi:ComF family protein